MALNLTNATSRPSTTGRTLVYTTPANTVSTIFDGTISNIDTINQATHYITAEIETTVGTFTSLGTYVAIPFGISPRFPKQVLQAGQKLHLTVETATMIDIALSIAEKTLS